MSAISLGVRICFGKLPKLVNSYALIGLRVVVRDFH